MIFVSRGYYNVLIHIQLALSHMLIKNGFWLLFWYLETSNPSYAIKEFIINFGVKNNFKNCILLNYALRQYIKEKKTCIHIKLSHF